MEVKVKVKDYLRYLKKASYPQLFDMEGMHKLDNVEKVYGHLETEETILEICLSGGEKSCDYSIRIDTDSPSVREYWYELDAGACISREIAPCYFIDASSVKPGQDNNGFYDGPLTKLAGEKRVKALLPRLDKCVEKLENRCEGLFQIGAMEGRGQSESLRIFTMDIDKGNLVEYLQEIGWEGDIPALKKNLTKWEPYSITRKFILDFDIYDSSVSGKIGINFGTSYYYPESVERLLSLLEEEGLCLPEKKEDVLRFIQAFPSYSPFIQNDISHFKIPFENGRAFMAKAYLRQGSHCYNPIFRAYSSPILMNLELTSRCPLRCPQCYCDLDKGKDMELSTALHWIKEAAGSGVQIVNLSGGETMLYPHLTTLIRECSARGMKANIAVSGYGIDQKVLEELEESGVSDICISLNGTTEEINRMSRDGYALVIHALELLKEMRYPRTCINWVMHSHNAEDLAKMLQLAEDYHVETLAVMRFKPDASHQLPSLPSGKQIREAAALLKAYQGNVKIYVEECFSQLKALMGEKFFFNKNQGISRGCGAGRDGISVSVDGKLTPCRHLELEEEWGSIAEYWEKSPLLHKLRRVEDAPEEPCSKCEYQKYCLPCMAVNWKLEGEIFMGDSRCPLAP